MSDNKLEETMYFKKSDEDNLNPRDVLLTVYEALMEKV